MLAVTPAYTTDGSKDMFLLPGHVFFPFQRKKRDKYNNQRHSFAVPFYLINVKKQRFTVCSTVLFCYIRTSNTNKTKKRWQH